MGRGTDLQGTGDAVRAAGVPASPAAGPGMPSGAAGALVEMSGVQAGAAGAALAAAGPPARMIAMPAGAPAVRTATPGAQGDAVAPAGAFGFGAPTLVGLVLYNAQHYGNRIALREKDYGIWQEYTWADYARHVVEMAMGLASLGFRPGDALLIMGDNRPRLYFGILAAQLLRGVPCPMYPDAIPSELAYIARRVNARFALAEDQEQVDKFLSLPEGGEDLAYVLYDDPRGLSVYDDPRLVSCDRLEALGREYGQRNPGFLDEQLRAVTPEDVAVLLHSSGTTGQPKGVPLTHRQALAAVRNAFAAGYFNEGEDTVAYLPVAWVGDFTFSVAAAAALRFTVHIPERQETVLRDLREIGPTMYFAPPRNWDHMLTHVQVRMEESGRLQRFLFRKMIPLAVELERERLAGRKPQGLAGLAKRAARWVGEGLIYGPIKDHLGLSRVRHAYTAGEAIGEDTFLFFRALGVNLKQFYGQTENAALTAAQTDDEVKLRTVGRPLPGVQVRISDAGEVLIKAESLFSGYYRQPQATEAAFLDGWFRTGDAGQLDEDGHLIILGRVEEVVTTAAGVRFVPQFIENQLKFSPYIKEAAVIGAGKPYLTAMICIDLPAVGHWAEGRGVTYTSYADLSQKPAVYDLIAGVVRRVNAQMPKDLRIRRFVNLHKEFDPDDGELTRTRKLRRNVINEHYAAVIDALYSGASEVQVAARVVYEDGRVGTIERSLRIRPVEDGP
ncbi:MAG TPA: AMP-binding protein [Limnochordales bacterium]